MSEEINTNVVEDGVHTYSGEDMYTAPTDPLIQDRLEWFQDQKLGLMIHWGAYSQLGIVESWALSDDDSDWSRHQIDWEQDGKAFKQQYIDLNKTFNPIRFQPDVWADIAKDNGFKYLVFTTKHHDGYCMYDSKYTDYKITGSESPFRNHRYADVCKHLFDEVRMRGLAVFAYFSKADWNVPSYWAGDKINNRMYRGPSYSQKDNPKLWEEFVQFTHNQVLEIATNYGRIDALWFDAGWVSRANGQDIRIEELMHKVREIQPHVLAVDRTCGGICENYVTPEQCVPEQPMNIPFESNLTIGNSFSFSYDEDYKSAFTLAQTLIDVIAKGGNLILNVGPQPDGRLPVEAVNSIKGLGEFMKVYGNGIYGTRPYPPYRQGHYAFTSKSDKIYAFFMHETEQHDDIREFVIPIIQNVSGVSLLSTGDILDYEAIEDGIKVALNTSTTKDYVTCFVIDVG